MTKGKIKAIVSNLLEIEFEGKVMQNEICHVTLGDKQLMAEVIKIGNQRAYAQLFEMSTSLRLNDDVTFSGELLEVDLGPGILSKNFDGLQNDLEAMKGTFIETGQNNVSINKEAKYKFTPLLQAGDQVKAGDWLGEVPENWIAHKIMVPFKLKGSYEIVKIADLGTYAASSEIAQLKGPEGEVISVSMIQKWPVKWALKSYREKFRPSKIFQTGLRVMDTLNPMAEGGTGYIPGAFGTGKTVLQQAIAKNNQADMVILVACGERANEVVEIFHTFPQLEDLKTGRKLKEKTTIICNTSNMPVAAREASVYVGMTIAEYYRNMGLKVLLLADSTSRWAQALREMSNRMEELPGTDAFPVELPAVIANFYGRAGAVALHNGSRGSITFLGTVSPAGGNFKEPVTESTAKVARCFYALSQKRADAKRYPAIDPIGSYSRYLDYEEFQVETEKILGENWIKKVKKMKDLLQRGIEARDQISILGDDSVPLAYHLDFWRSELLDFAIIQQDSFDDVDMNSPLERQQSMLNLALSLCEQELEFEDFNAVSTHYKKLINTFKQLNYSAYKTENYTKYSKELEEFSLN